MIGGYAIFELRNKEEAWPRRSSSCSCTGEHMPGWEGTCEVRALAAPEIGRRPARSMPARQRLMRRPGNPAGGDDGRRRSASHHPRGVADRAAAADHQPGADAARRAAGRGPDAGSAAGGAGALARDRRAGKARRLADGDRQAPGAGSSAPPPDAGAQARHGRARSRAGAAGHARFRRRARRRHRRRNAAADLHRLPSAVCRARPARRWRCG